MEERKREREKTKELYRKNIVEFGLVSSIWIDLFHEKFMTLL